MQILILIDQILKTNPEAFHMQVYKIVANETKTQVTLARIKTVKQQKQLPQKHSAPKLTDTT